ncbi:NACHT, LRR and PYD domains-containing protein 12 [Anabarilius grahami]|uniref:NACHT, LRR and PYD domains-containing protein 12 n=1 Tax=Anabarilius grahami TaxID=495550 RepID=A0A3N0XEZ9_ANAGA|nr:NACHT, LRR and PYD domains-containing protein 12 [Anabarilius grahami]
MRVHSTQAEFCSPGCPSLRTGFELLLPYCSHSYPFLFCEGCVSEILCSDRDWLDLACLMIRPALQSSNSVLRELDLSNNDLQDYGVNFISDGLKSPNCQLQILSLAGCNVSDQHCEIVSSTLESSNSVLRELDLSNNDLQDSGVNFISDGLKSPNCQLQILRLAGCNLSGQHCEIVSSALQSSNCVLRELDLSNNDLQDSGVNFISDGLKSPNCQLQILRRPDQHCRPSMSQPDPFQALVDALRRTLTTNPPSPSPVTSPSPAPAVTTVSTVSSPSPPMYGSPVARPAPYSGLAEDCSGFLLQCELVLEMQPHLYRSDTSKIAFLISQLSGKALKWADSIWSQHGAVTQSYSAFISHFREVFGKPITDSSAGEKLYNLKQGSMSIYDYALQFRTLAAVCGWNEQALITTYRQGLEMRLHLAACKDSIGLEKFIQHSIRCATRIQACLQEHQDQLLFISPLCRSEPVSSPDPPNEPMDVENSRLTL